MGYRWTLLALVVPLACVAAPDAGPDQLSQGRYRLPFAEGTTVKVFDDFHTHQPPGRVDLYAVGGRERIAHPNGEFKRERNGRFCGVPTGVVTKGLESVAKPC